MAAAVLMKCEDIFEIVDDVEADSVIASRRSKVTPTLQVCLAFHFHAKGAFQNVCGCVYFVFLYILAEL